MEKPAAQPQRERFQSFDPLASVDLMRFDLQTQGRVLPETLERVQDEELSYLMEAMDRAACSSFVLQRRGNDCVYFDRGEWRPYSDMLLTGIEAAKADASKDFRKQFLVDKARQDYRTYHHVRRLVPGQTYAWYSSYPYAEAEQYGEDFIRSCGFVPHRKMGFLYTATCESNGNIVLQSQTVDQSDEDAFMAAVGVFETNPGANVGDMTQAYDARLAVRYGEEFHAGRRDEEIRANAYETIRAQRDLIEYFMSGLRSLAEQWHLNSGELERAVKKHTFGVWAAFKKRIDGGVVGVEGVSGVAPVARGVMLQQEVRRAFNEFASQGRVLIGCGGEIRMLQGEQDILNADPSDVFESIFGKKDTDEFGPLVFKCKQGHTNRRPRGKLIATCHVKGCAKDSVGCA